MNIAERINGALRESLSALELPDVGWNLEHPRDLSHGDYATNLPLVLAKKLNQNPVKLGEKIALEIEKLSIEEIEKIEVAPAGFINFHLSRKFFVGSVVNILSSNGSYGRNDHVKNYKVMVEYTDPNPFKEFHIGHLMSNTIGESIARLVEFCGAEVRRVNYQGDVGLQIAKAIYGMKVSGASSFTLKSLGEAYALGSKAYAEDEKVKEEINELNKKIYDRSDKEVNRLYDLGRKISLDEFEIIYKKLGTTFDDYFFESEVGPIGKKLVEENLSGGVFVKSEGAIVFKGGEHGLHTRVFINSLGLPTYEAKELGLAILKRGKYPFDLSITITANEITEYFKVVKKALQLIDPALAGKIMHVPHGMLRLPSGKMSSRTGNVITAEGLLADLEENARQKLSERAASSVEVAVNAISVGAIKYSVLRQAMGKDIIFDMEAALSFEGDSGPYLQYSYVRTQSVLHKAKESGERSSAEEAPLTTYTLERLLYRFPEVIYRAAKEYAPHYVVTYLTELAASFNSFYANTRILGNAGETPYLLALTEATATVLKNGLHVLGISAPEAM